MPKPTLTILAQRLGVSHTTVSNAFSRPDQLSAELRDRILREAEEIGYTGPSLAAASLRTGRTKTLGVLFTDNLSYAFTDPVATGFLAGVAGVAEEAGYAITIVSAPRTGTPGPTGQAVMDGLIVYSVDEQSPALKTVRARAILTVLVDQRPVRGLSAVNVTDRAGAGLAVDHLIQLGHRRLALVSVALGPDRTAIVAPTAKSRSFVAAERLAGWRAAAEAATLPIPVIISCPVNGRAGGRQAAELLAALPKPPTAVACLSDELALGVIEGLRAARIQVPAQVSVIGFDDSPSATPFLSTVRQPYQDKGKVAAQLLLDHLDSPKRPRRQVLPTELIMRGSTGPAPHRRRS